MIRVLLTSLVLFVLIPTPAHAVDDRFDQGSWELTIAGDPSDLTLEPSIAYYIADYVALAAHVGLSSLEISVNGGPDVNEDDFALDLGIAVTHPTHGAIFPTAGIALVYFEQTVETPGSTDLDLSGFGIQAAVGLRFLVGSNASVNLGISISAVSVSDDIAGLTADATGTNLGIGYSLYF